MRGDRTQCPARLQEIVRACRWVECPLPGDDQTAEVRAGTRDEERAGTRDEERAESEEKGGTREEEKAGTKEKESRTMRGSSDPRACRKSFVPVDGLNVPCPVTNRPPKREQERETRREQERETRREQE